MPVVLSEVVIRANTDQSSNASSIAGIQSATVVDNKDPDQKGRVKVSFHFDENTSTSWARVVQFMAGNNYGSYFLPEIGDEVLVAFENNNHNNPIVIGCLYNGEKKQASSYDKDNYTKNIKTKAGNEINFSDKAGEEQVLIINKTAGDNQILLTLKDNGKITIESKGKIEIKAPEIDLNGSKEINIKGGQVNISGTKVSLKADGGDVSAEGVNITLKANASLTAKGAASAELSASGTTTVKGAIVMIN